MKILLVTPAPPRSRKGNRITAQRWSRILRERGHRVDIVESYEHQPCDLLLALHARRSARSVAQFAEARPKSPLILTLTGTDLYRDIHNSKPAQRSLELAQRLVVLQPHGIQALPKQHQHKARVIYQSVQRPQSVPRPLKTVFEVCVVGHLRRVKDPFRAALAARRLPGTSRIRIVQLGSALSPDMEQQALAEMQRNPRYRWLGELPRWKSMQHLGRSRLLALTSELEGGANVVSEALAVGTPVISTRISGSIGLLGEDYPGYFEVNDTAGLTELLLRAETDLDFYELLKSRCRSLAWLADPAEEQRRWRELLAEFA